MEAASFYRRVWRWHFYAGLLVLPAIVVLALSGAVYLFKPQIERWEERAFHGLPTGGAAAPSAQVAAALAAHPGTRLVFYRLPERAGDAAMIHLGPTTGNAAMRDVFVAPQGQVLGSLDPEARIIAWDRKIHGQLLLGKPGSWLVELAASWAIVMILTGLYLWWPRGGGSNGWGAGAFWPRLTLRGRRFWRDLHGVAGFWVSGLALVLLFTGLPWADVWGSAFKALRQNAGWMKAAPEWTIGGKPAADLHAGHDHNAMMAGMHHHAARGFDPALLNRMVARAAAESLAFPVVVVPPGAPAGEGGNGKAAKGWLIKSEAANRPLRITLRHDAAGTLLKREDFSAKHPIDQVVGYGIAWHEGALFGWFNQLVGVFTALALITLAVSGVVMWWKRRPAGSLGAPPAPAITVRPGAAVWLAGSALAVWLPLFAASVLVLAVLDRVLGLVLGRLAPRA